MGRIGEVYDSVVRVGLWIASIALVIVVAISMGQCASKGTTETYEEPMQNFGPRPKNV